MLILPLHKPLNRHTFPWATMLLMLVNIYVFFALQATDEPAMERARHHYLSSELGGHEVPAYRRYLQDAGNDKALKTLDDVPESERAGYVAARTLNDVAFQQALRTGRLFDDDDARVAWTHARRGYDALIDKVFTLRHSLRSSEWSPWRMFASAFLHGDADHLIGNMLFLLAIGLLLEGAIGPVWLLAVYTLGAMGSSAVSVLWRWGEGIGGLGASGAIAAMMGAFCVVWGLRRVRFFYWVVVLFDYVRAPAIALLPLWLGWELYNLAYNTGSNIGFDAHAGGLACGALLGALLVLARQTRPAFMEDPEAEAPADDRWMRAQAHLGRMENAEAERLLAELAEERPHDIALQQARYRAARNSGQTARMREHAFVLLRLAPAGAGDLQVQREVVNELRRAGVVLDAPTQAALLSHWLDAGLLHEAETLLGDEGTLSREDQAQAWLRLALRHPEHSADGERRRLLEQLLQRFPEQPGAQKAKFLLENA